MNKPNSDPRVLFAFYDLEVAPVTFDFYVFLTLSDLHRRKLGCDEIRLVVVPGKMDGYRELDIDDSPTEKDWRLDNILLGGFRLIPAIKGTNICATRDEAAQIETQLAQNIFPEGYTVAEPVGDFKITNYTYEIGAGQPPPSLLASDHAIKLAGDWLRTVMPEPREVVTITIRTNPIQTARNSNLEEWAKFASSLDRDRFLPVIIPETETLFSGKPELLAHFPSFDPAALNVQLRAAIYELAFINLGVSNGPRELCYYSNNAYITYKIAVDGAPSAAQKYLDSIAYQKGTKPAKATACQKWVWENDTFEVIKRTFDEMVAEMDAAGAAKTQRQSLRGSASLQERMEIGYRMQKAGHLDRVDTIFEKILEEIPDYPEALYAMGRTSLQRNRASAASQFFARTLEFELPTFKFALDYAQSLLMENKFGESVNWASKALSFEPDSIPALEMSAEANLMAGNRQLAVDAYLKVLNLAPDNYEAMFKAGEILFSLDRSPEAFHHFNRAINLFDKDAHEEFTVIMERLGRIFAEIGCASESLAAFLVANGVRSGAPKDLEMLSAVQKRLIQLSAST